MNPFVTDQILQAAKGPFFIALIGFLFIAMSVGSFGTAIDKTNNPVMRGVAFAFFLIWGAAGFALWYASALLV